MSLIKMVRMLVDIAFGLMVIKLILLLVCAKNIANLSLKNTYVKILVDLDDWRMKLC